jgi:hypothetical protein
MHSPVSKVLFVRRIADFLSQCIMTITKLLHASLIALTLDTDDIARRPLIYYSAVREQLTRYTAVF